MLKIGIGYDLHRLIKNREFILGGVKIEGPFGPDAHSDGDAFIHALADSILSPLGAPDIGFLYPDTDASFKGLKSMEILENIRDNYLRNCSIVNIDGVVILDSPKISPYIPEMKKSISEVLGITVNRIGIKAKTTENTRPFIVECQIVTLLDVSF
jgi:2-C-methyl-D-erythritol 2,4-cyclodiphosphate synthase